MVLFAAINLLDNLSMHGFFKNNNVIVVVILLIMCQVVEVLSIINKVIKRFVWVLLFLGASKRRFGSWRLSYKNCVDYSLLRNFQIQN